MTHIRQFAASVALIGLLVQSPTTIALQPPTELSLTGATVSASSQSSSTRGATKAIDRDTTTRWEASNSSPGTWLAVSFPQPVNLHAATISEYGQRIAGFKIQTFDGTNWSDKFSATGVPTGIISFGAQNVRAVRVLTTTKANGQPSIAELRLFGTLTTASCTAGSVINGTVDCGGLVIGKACGSGPLLTLGPNASVSNLRVAPGASGDGIVCQGNCTLNNVTWLGACGPAVRTPDVVQAPGTAGPRVLVLNSSYTAEGLPRTPFVPSDSLRNGSIEVRYSRFHGELHSIIAKPQSGNGNTRGQNSFTLINNTIHGQIVSRTHPSGNEQNAVVGVHAGNGERATIYGLQIAGYQPGRPIVCNVWAGTMDTLVPLGEQWNTTACSVSQQDVTTLPTP